jgi:hypothetical protein
MVNVNTYRNPSVYALHAGDFRFAYVGVTTKNSKNRLYEHVYRARNGHKAPVYEWMRSVGIRRVRVVDLELVESTDTLPGLELKWIATLLASGHDLRNQIGRDGVANSMSSASRARISDAAKGRPTWIKGLKGEAAGWTEERRAAMRERRTVQ